MKKLALFLAAATVASTVVAIPSAAVDDITPSDKVLKVSYDNMEIDGVIDGAYLSSYHITHVWQDYKDGDPTNTDPDNWNHWECGIYGKKETKRDENGFQEKDENGAAIEIDNPDYERYPYDDPAKCVKATSYFLWDPDGYLFVAIDVFDPTKAVVSDAKYEKECENTGSPFGPWLQDSVMPEFAINGRQLGRQKFTLYAERGGRYAHLFSTGESWAKNWRGWAEHLKNYDVDGLWATTQRADGYTVELVIPVNKDYTDFDSTMGQGKPFGDGYVIDYGLNLCDALDLGTGDDDFKNYGVDPAREQDGIIVTGTSFYNFVNFSADKNLIDASANLKLTLSDEEPTNVHEHTWTAVEGTNTATCTEKGYQTLHCEGCGLDSSEETPTIPHTWAAEKTVDLEPSCIKDGSKSTKCTVCGAIDPDSVEAIPALGGEHTYDPNAEKVVDKEATCDEDGSRSIHCEVCKFPVEETVEVIPALGHNYGEPVVKAATCTEDGSSTIKCDRCGKEEVTPIPALGHKYGEPVVKPATCTEAGSSTVKCSVCGNEEVTAIPALGHKYGEPVVKPATCTEAGSSTAKCTVCGHEDVKEIPALGHDFVDGVCTRCGETEAQSLVGDVNGDGKVNSKDLTRLMKHIAGDKSAEIVGSADINGDEKVNSKDLTRLMKMIAEG